MQDGDVPATYADMNALSEWVDFNPATSLAIGIEKFINWYLDYYEIKKTEAW